MVKKFLNDTVKENTLVECVDILYNNGYNAKDLEDYINRDKKIDSVKRCKLLIYLIKCLEKFVMKK